MPAKKKDGITFSNIVDDQTIVKGINANIHIYINDVGEIKETARHSDEHCSISNETCLVSLIANEQNICSLIGRVVYNIGRIVLLPLILHSLTQNRNIRIL